MSLETKIRDAFERHANDGRPGGAEVWPRIERRIERAHRWRMIASLAGAAVLVAVAVVAVPRFGGRMLEPVTPPISEPTDVPQLVARIPVRAVAMASGEDSIWALSSGDRDGDRGTLHRIDPETDRVTGSVRIGRDPSAVAVGAGSVWVLHGEGCGATRPCDPGVPPPSSFEAGDASSVWRIDPRTLAVEDRIYVGTRFDLTFSAGHPWIASTANEEGLARIELNRRPIDNATRPWGSIVGMGRVHLAVGDEMAWAVSETSASDDARPLLSVIDLSRREVVDVVSLVAHGTVPDVTLGFGSAWVTTGTETSASGLMRIDPSSRSLIALIVLPDAAPVGLTSVTPGYGYVWATSARGFLWKIDPTTNSAPIEPLLVGSSPPVPTNAVAAGFGSIWVAADDGIWRFAP